MLEPGQGTALARYARYRRTGSLQDVLPSSEKAYLSASPKTIILQRLRALIRADPHASSTPMTLLKATTLRYAVCTGEGVARSGSA